MIKTLEKKWRTASKSPYSVLGYIVDASTVASISDANASTVMNWTKMEVGLEAKSSNTNSRLNDLRQAKKGVVSAMQTDTCEVLNEFTHGKEEKVSKTGFKKVLSDILLGMAAGLKRDPIIIPRIDGEDLQEFINTPGFETDALCIFSEVESSDVTLHDHIVKALQKLGVDQGLPPISDPWVMSNIVEPALKCIVEGASNESHVLQETFLKAFKETLAKIVERLKELPVIVADTKNTYDGSVIKSLLANKFETDKVLDAAVGGVPRDKQGRLSKEYLRLALDSLRPSAGLPPYDAINEEVNAMLGEQLSSEDEEAVLAEFDSLEAELMIEDLPVAPDSVPVPQVEPDYELDLPDVPTKAPIVSHDIDEDSTIIPEKTKGRVIRKYKDVGCIYTHISLLFHATSWVICSCIIPDATDMRLGPNWVKQESSRPWNFKTITALIDKVGLIHSS